MSDPAHGLRASDADREATAARLHAAALEGRLDAEELDERLTAAYAAKHCAELERLTADVTPPALAPAPAHVPQFVRTTPRTNALAIGSFACSLMWFGWFGSVLGVILGHVALAQISASGGRQRGTGFAVAGLVLGYGALLLALLFMGGFWVA